MIGALIIGILIGITLRALYDALTEMFSYTDYECRDCGLVIRTEKDDYSFIMEHTRCPECGGKWKGFIYSDDKEDE